MEGSDIPSRENSIQTSPEMFCQEHLKAIEAEDIPLTNCVLTTQQRLLGNSLFYEIAYRIKNGYAPPEDMNMDNVPDGEKPDVVHINDALEEIQPLCCWLIEELDDPFPDQPGGEFLHHLIHQAQLEQQARE